jgi:hypothetical protein
MAWRLQHSAWLGLIAVLALPACGRPTEPALPASSRPALARAFSDCLPHRGKPVSLTPSYEPYQELTAQVAETGPLFVTSSEAVPLCALVQSGYMLDVILRHRKDVASVLRDAGALTAVFARSESVCDLLYFADLAGSSVCTEPGGLGGVPGRPATACSERNVLKEPDDPFGRGTREDGESVCVHELGHTIMNVGLSDVERDEIRERYQAVVSAGQLWTDDAFGNPTFAFTNADEFWAEMTQTYFCANPEVLTFLHNGVNCADELKAYDPMTFRLIDRIYRHAAADLR